MAFFSVFMIIMAFIGVYFYFFFRRMAGCLMADASRRVRSLASAAAALAAMAPMAFHILSVWAVAVLYLLGFSLCADVAYLVVKRVWMGGRRGEGRGAKGCEKGREGRGIRGRRGNAGDCLELVYRCGVIPILCTVLMIGYGYWNMDRIVRTDYKIETDKDVGDGGIKIAMISDLHYKTIKGIGHLQECVAEIQAAGPDLVVLCGDIVEEGTSKEAMREAMSVLGSMDCPLGIYYVYGNHDRTRYAGNPHFSAKELEDAIQSSGIRTLVDEQARPVDGLTIIGRDDRSFPIKGSRMGLDQLTEDVAKEDFILLLDHQPCELLEADEAGCDLMLSGHTHAGQIWPAGQLSEGLGMVEMAYGRRELDRLQVVVSSGLAGWGYPIRTSRHCEYVVVTVE